VAEHDGAARWRFDALTRDELYALAPAATVLVPLGSTEQHGHHLPVRVDTAIVTALAEGAAAQAAEQIPVVVTPTLPFGFAEHHIPFGGTISLRAGTYADVIADIGTSLGREGFRRIVFLNGHGGNDAAMRFVLDRLACQPFDGLHIAGASYWNLAADVLAEVGLDAALVPGHAGHFETSAMLAVMPDLVRLGLRPQDPTPAMPIAQPESPGAAVRRSGQWERSDGRSDDASLASRELGVRIIEGVVDRIAEFLVSFHRSTEAPEAAPPRPGRSADA
jgi:creatinine amidohydrolase